MEKLPKGVVLVTDNGFYTRRPLHRVLAEVAETGLAAIELREPALSPSKFYELARKVKRELAGKPVKLLLQGHPEICRELDLHGVHLEEGDPPLHQVREMLGADKIIGSSLAMPAQVGPAGMPPADYFAVGPVFATRSKPCTQPEWGVTDTASAFSRSPKPLVAAGGITARNLPELLAAGIDRVSVVSAILAHPQPAKAAAELAGLMS